MIKNHKFFEVSVILTKKQKFEFYQNCTIRNNWTSKNYMDCFLFSLSLYFYKVVHGFVLFAYEIYFRFIRIEKRTKNNLMNTK